jgi:hypothetical protein
MAADGVRHGAYLCLSAPGEAAATLAVAPVPALAAELGLQNEFRPHAGHPPHAIAFLRCVEALPGDIDDEGLAGAVAAIHVASNEADVVSAFCAEFARLLPSQAALRILSGTVQPTQYTGGAMHAFAYGRQRTQQSGESMPHAYLLPLRKSPEWWAKDWMERHTYFLPRYDGEGRMVSEGHALAAAAGVPALMRRTYRCLEPDALVKADATGLGGGYDFLTYFECADAGVPTFHAVCAALRDLERNPEWRFVREGPTWRGRRMESWPALWTAPDAAPPVSRLPSADS